MQQVGECSGLRLFSACGKSDLEFVDNTMDSFAYCAIIGITLLPYIDDKHPTGPIFPQDNASFHSPEYTKEWFMDMVLLVMNWAARSPDLNPIENICGLLA